MPISSESGGEVIEQDKGKEGQLVEKEEEAMNLVNQTGALVYARVQAALSRERELTLPWPSARRAGPDQTMLSGSISFGPARPPTGKAQTTELALELLTHVSVLY